MSAPRRPPLLVVGLDGADLGLVRELQSSLPTLAGLCDRGVYAPLVSTLPFSTLPAWTSMLTAAPPGEHGVFDFTERVGYRVRFSGARGRRLATTFARLDDAGRRVALLGFPGTYPPEPLRHGIVVSGWDSPVAFEADATFVHPRSLHAEIVRRLGPLRFDDVDEFDGGPGWHGALADRLVERVRRKLDLYRWLLGRERWDVFACYFGETDTAGHHLWALSDPRSPRRPPSHAPAGWHASPLAQVYRAVDEAVGALAEATGPAANVLVASDHGFRGTSDEVVYVNRLLENAGLCTLSRPGGRLAARARGAVLRALPARLRQRCFRAAGAVLPSWLESRVRFGAIDFGRTLAFSEELPYAPSIWLNLAGRDPAGTVRAGERDRVMARVIDALGPLAAAAHRREEIHRGPAAHLAPDLLLELAAPDGYVPNLAPSSLVAAGVVRRRLATHELLGRKGSPLSGAHRRNGLLAGDGPDLAGGGAIEADVVEAGRLIASLAGLDGARPVLQPAPPPLDARAEALLAGRLRALGYID